MLYQNLAVEHYWGLKEARATRRVCVVFSFYIKSFEHLLKSTAEEYFVWKCVSSIQYYVTMKDDLVRTIIPKELLTEYVFSKKVSGTVI